MTTTSYVTGYRVASGRRVRSGRVGDAHAVAAGEGLLPRRRAVCGAVVDEADSRRRWVPGHPPAGACPACAAVLAARADVA